MWRAAVWRGDDEGKDRRRPKAEAAVLDDGVRKAVDSAVGEELVCHMDVALLRLLRFSPPASHRR